MTFEFENETYHVANPHDSKDLYPHAVLITVGVYGLDKVIVFTDKSCDMCDIMSVLEDALDALPNKDWDCSDQVNAAYDEAFSNGKSQEDAWDYSQDDVTAINGGSHYVDEWMCGGITKELEDAARKHGLEVMNNE